MPSRVRRRNPLPPDVIPSKPTEPLAPAKGAKLSALTGIVRTIRPNSPAAFDIPWANVARYADSYEKWEKKHGLPRFLNAAVGVVESDSMQFRNGVTIERWDNYPQDGPSRGIMQVKNDINQGYAPNADAYTVDGNIELGSAMMGAKIKQRGSWQQAIVRDYFPDDDPNGTTRNAYVKAITSLMSEMANQLKDAPGPVDPGPIMPTDPYSVIFGGKPYRVDYGFRDDVGLNYYGYGVGHGTSATTQHTGDDVLVPDETPLYAPFDGIVTCVGWEGEVTWGQGCGYFEDYSDNLGHDTNVGNITIKGDGKAKGYKLVLGHSSAATVKYGQRVKAGEHVGWSGGMNGPHTHVEVAVPDKNGVYWLRDPKPALIEAMAGSAPVIYVEPIKVPQPQEFDVAATVYALKDGVPVLLRADLSAAHTNADLKQGDDFPAPMLVMGNDERWYWVSARGSRVPIDGTWSPDAPMIPTKGT